MKAQVVLSMEEYDALKIKADEKSADVDMYFMFNGEVWEVEHVTDESCHNALLSINESLRDRLRLLERENKELKERKNKKATGFGRFK